MSEPTKKTINRFYEDIIEHIKSMIVSGELKPGQKIPSERDLAERFNVSRIPVREALKILEYMGVITNVRGDGMYLKSIDLATLFSKVNFAFSITNDTLHYFTEVRDALEATAAYYAALRRDDDDIAALQISLDRMEKTTKSPDSSFDERLTLSHEFHTALVRASHNPVLSGVYDSLFELLDVSKRITLANRGFDDHSQSSHYEIFKHILLKDADSARQSMMAHLDKALEKIEASAVKSIKRID